MSLRSKASGVILMALIQAWGLPAAQADGPLAPPPHADMDGGLPPGFHALALSEAQQDKVFAILHAQAPTRRSLARELERARTALHDYTRTEAFDARRARELADALGKAVAEEALLRARSEQQIRALLTDEQRVRLERRPQAEMAEPRGGADAPDRRAAPAHRRP